MSDQYEIGATIPLRPVVVVDRSGSPITGSSTLTVEIERDADGYLWDWNDSTFKASGWTTKAGALSEVSAANAPGWYKRTSGWNSTAQSAGWYWITYRDTAAAAANMPQSEEVRLGGWAGTIATNLDAAITSRASPTNITAGTITNVTNLTNAPTSGDLTATMKASVTTAATAATPTVTVGSLGTDAVSAAAVSAAAVTKIAAGVIDDATPFHGASIATILGRVDVASSTRASSTALADVAADAAQAVDALYNAKRLAANGTLTQYAADGSTPAYVATVTDKTGQPIDLQAGEPARTTALVPVP